MSDPLMVDNIFSTGLEPSVSDTPCAAEGRDAQMAVAAIGVAGTGLGILAARYLKERRARGEIGPVTERNAYYTLGTLVRFVGYDAHPHRLTKRVLERWLARKPLSNATRRTELSIVKGFCAWLVERKHLAKDPTRTMRRIRQPRYVPRAMTPGDVSRLLSTVETRDQLIVLLMAQEGLRCCEIARLELGDVDWSERSILVRGKGDHERVLPVSEETWTTLSTYADGMTAGPLIRSLTNPLAGLSARYVSQRINRCCREADVRGTSHRMRHGAAAGMLKCGAHVRDVQFALGHKSLSTTQMYMPLLVGNLRTAMGGRRYRTAI